jgi:hypothetical protein
MCGEGEAFDPAEANSRHGLTWRQSMTKLRLARIAALVFGLLAAAGAALSAFGPERIVLTEAQLQDRIGRQLPREFRGVTVERAAISLADGRIQIRVEAHATALGQTFTTIAFARGTPRYNAEEGELFFDAEDVRLEDFTIGSGSLAERAERLGARIGGRLGEAVEQNLPRIEAAAAGIVAIGIKAYLAARPVYRFKDDFKGLVLRATITDIAIVGDMLVVGVSLIRLTIAVAAWGIGLALAALVGVWLWRGARQAS